MFLFYELGVFTTLVQLLSMEIEYVDGHVFFRVTTFLESLTWKSSGKQCQSWNVMKKSWNVPQIVFGIHNSNSYNTVIIIIIIINNNNNKPTISSAP